MTCKFHNIRFYNFEPKAIHCMVLDYDSKTLAVSRNDASIELWNLEGIPYMTQVIPGTPSGSVEAMCWVRNRLFTTGLSGAVVEWDLQTLTPKQSVLVTGQAAWCIDVSGASNKIAIGTEQGYLNLYSLEEETINFERIFDKQEGRILCCKFDPSGVTLVTGSIETIRIWNVCTGQALHRMGTGRAERNKETIVWCLAVTSDLTIISGDSRGRLTFWDGNLGEQLESTTTHKCDVLSVCLSQDERSLYCSGVDPVIVSYAKVKMKQKGNAGHVDKWVKSIQRNIHTHDVRALVLQDNKLFSGGVDGYLAVSSYPPKVLVKYPPQPQDHAISFSQQSRLLCLRYAHSIEIWRLGSILSNEQGRNSTYSADDGMLEITDHPIPNGHVNGEKETYLDGLDSRGNGKSKPKRLRLSEGANLLLRLATPSSSSLVCCALSPDSRWIAYSTETHFRIFKFTLDEESPTLSKVLPLPSECTPCHQMIFSPDSKSLIMSSADCQIRMLYIHLDGAVTVGHTIDTKKILKERKLLHLYASEISSKYYHLVIADTASNIGVWKIKLGGDVPTPSLIASLPQYVCPPTALTLDVHTNHLIVAYSDQKIVEYSLTKTKFTEFSARLRSEEFGLGPRWTTRLFPVTCIQVHPTRRHLILLNDDCGLYVINKNAEKELEVEVKKSRLQSSQKESKLFFTIKKQKHLVAAKWIQEDEAALVIVEPDTLVEKLPPAFMRNRFGAM